jgi:hypothetical protein
MRKEAAIRVCVFTLAIAAGCSSSSSNGPSDAGGTGGTGGTGGGGSVAPRDGGDASVPSICDRIPVADIQALLPDTVTSVTTTIGGGSQGGIICEVDDDPGIGLLIQTYPSDAQKAQFDYLLGGDPTSQPFTYSISGIGDEAYYFEVTTDDAGTGVSAPSLAAHKASGASPSCGIESNDPPDTTMHTTPDGAGGFTATKSDVVAYVQLMGKVCNDVFALSN